MHRRTTTAGRFFSGAGDHARRLERVEVLAQRRVRQPELGGQVRRGGRLDALQPFDDAVLRVERVCHARNSTEGGCISEGCPCIITMQNTQDGFDKMYRS